MKTISEIIKWFKLTKNIENDFNITAMLMEKAGTCGALFRNLSRPYHIDYIFGAKKFTERTKSLEVGQPYQ